MRAPPKSFAIGSMNDLQSTIVVILSIVQEGCPIKVPDTGSRKLDKGSKGRYTRYIRVY